MNQAVEQLYEWIDAQVANTGDCKACGDCCDFESFGHRLYVTSVEMKYFAEKMRKNGDWLRSAQQVVPVPTFPAPMTNNTCPYRIDGKCTVYQYRFAGCRIFACGRDEDLESRVSEESLQKLKTIGDQFNIPYQYTDLKTALNTHPL